MCEPQREVDLPQASVNSCRYTSTKMQTKWKICDETYFKRITN